jgi:hypothetical protein
VYIIPVCRTLVCGCSTNISSSNKSIFLENSFQSNTFEMVSKKVKEGKSKREKRRSYSMLFFTDGRRLSL